MEQPTPNGHARHSKRRTRNVARERLIAALSVVVLFVVGGAALALISPGRTPSGTAKADVWTAVATEAPVATDTAAAGPVTAEPTPYFASFRGVRLRLPVPAASVTVLAFHQSSYTDTVAMTSLVPFESISKARAVADTARATVKAGGAATVLATPASGAENDKGVWTGSALQLWRNGVGGKMNSAVDCGASAGTPVLAPIDGTVMEIRPYKLYGKCDDFEIHIKPDAWNDVDVIVLHVVDPTIVAGARVTAGVTRIASVRNLAKTISGIQLRSYTLNGGNHTHVQINTIPKPGLTWIVGQDPPSLVRH